MAINVSTPRCTTMVVNDMETIGVEIILGSGEQSKKWCQSWDVVSNFDIMQKNASPNQGTSHRILFYLQTQS